MSLKSDLSRVALSLGTLSLGVLLAYAGLAKIDDSTSAEEFLFRLTHIRAPLAIQVLAVAEILLGAWLVSGVRRSTAAACAASLFVAFAISHAFADPSFPSGGACGCLGRLGLESDASGWAWIGLNLGAATASVLIAVYSSVHTNAAVRGSSPPQVTLSASSVQGVDA